MESFAFLLMWDREPAPIRHGATGRARSLGIRWAWWRRSQGNLRFMADRTESSIVIAAAPGAVLDVIADFERYPEWAGEVKKVVVISEDGDGWADQVEFTLSAGAIKDNYVLEYDWDVAEDGTGVVSWILVSAQVLKAMNGSYTLEADGTETALTYRLSVDVKIPMLGILKRKAEKVIIDTALKELKKHVEA
jgi:hypothetical protein